MKRKTKPSRKSCLYTEICSGYFFPQRGHKTSQCEQNLFVLLDGSKPQDLISMRVQRVRTSGKGPILLLLTMPVLNFIATPETCSGEAGGAAGQAVGLSTTLAGSQGQLGQGRDSQPSVGPGLSRNSGGGLQCKGSSPAGRGFPRRKPEGASAAGAAGTPQTRR